MNDRNSSAVQKLTVWVERSSGDIVYGISDEGAEYEDDTVNAMAHLRDYPEQ